MAEWLGQFLADAQDAVLVGAVPDFDARHLELVCRKVGATPTWDHHLLDVETLALPLIAPGPDGPRSLAKTCQALGVDHDKDQAHGALYDARQAMRVFDRVWELMAAVRAGDQPLPDAVPRPATEPEPDDATAGEKEPARTNDAVEVAAATTASDLETEATS